MNLMSLEEDQKHENKGNNLTEDRLKEKEHSTSGNGSEHAGTVRKFLNKMPATGIMRSASVNNQNRPVNEKETILSATSIDRYLLGLQDDCS